MQTIKVNSPKEVKGIVERVANDKLLLIDAYGLKESDCDFSDNVSRKSMNRNEASINKICKVASDAHFCWGYNDITVVLPDELLNGNINIGQLLGMDATVLAVKA